MSDTQSANISADPLGPTVLYACVDGIARITLNRPDVANAMAPDQREVIIRLLDQADADPDVRVVVLGAAGRFFCAGADVGSIAKAAAGRRMVGDTARAMRAPQRLIAAVLDCRKPVVAAVQGPAVGLGAHLAFACDLVVAHEAAYFLEPFVLRGLTIDTAGAYLLARRVGLQRAKEMVFLAEKLPAREALALGLVNRVADATSFESEVQALAAKLAAAATVAIGLSKQMLNAALDADRASAFGAEALAQEVNGGTDDFKEGIGAFKERRLPAFQGR